MHLTCNSKISTTNINKVRILIAFIRFSWLSCSALWTHTETLCVCYNVVRNISMDSGGPPLTPNQQPVNWLMSPTFLLRETGRVFFMHFSHISYPKYWSPFSNRSLKQDDLLLFDQYKSNVLADLTRTVAAFVGKRFVRWGRATHQSINREVKPEALPLLTLFYAMFCAFRIPFIEKRYPSHIPKLTYEMSLII